MSRLFVSHSSADNTAAFALGRWLAEQGYGDIFLDIDPSRGLAPGERWMEALRAAADRCEAVLCLVSRAWLDSKWCLAEFLLARSLHKRIFGLIIEPVPIARLPPEMTGEWQICELVDPDHLSRVDAGDMAVTFSEAGLGILRRGLERAGLDARGFVWPPADEPTRIPYRGLRALEPKDAAIFFGRDALIIRGMDQVAGMVEAGVDRLLVVLGASGAGKSSFLQAGLWPRLARDDSRFLALPVIRPQAAAIGGPTGLVAALTVAFARFGQTRPPGPLKTALAAGGAAELAGMLAALAGYARARLLPATDMAAPTVLLALDQAEELFVPEGAAEAEVFLSMLAGALAVLPRMIVVATIRTDRYHHFQEGALLSGVKRSLFDLPPMPQSEFKAVIEGPAQRATEAGRPLVIEPALTEALISDAVGADALPLLGFTLERLWLDYGAAGRLTRNAYLAMGGVQGSIEAAVASALADPGRAPAIPADAAAQYALLRTAFVPWLARVAPGTGERLRRTCRIADIPAAAQPVVERFVAARLLVADRRDGADVVEVAHESLLRRWPTLVAWLDADAAELTQVEEIERAAAEWDRNARRDDWLDHRADRLEMAERLLRRSDFAARLGERGGAYLTVCRALADCERAAREVVLIRQARLQRRVWWALGAVALAMLVGVSGTLWQFRENAKRQAALDRAEVDGFAELAAVEQSRGDMDGALRLAAYAAQRGLTLDPGTGRPLANAQLAVAAWGSGWRIVLDHPAAVQRVAFSPGNGSIVTAGSDSIARLWDTRGGRIIAALAGHTGSLTSAAFSPDGAWILTGATDGTARLWNGSDGTPGPVLKVGTPSDAGATKYAEKVYAAAFSPRGTRIVTGTAGGHVEIWTAPDGRRIAGFEHGGSILAAVFSPDGTRVATASDDGTARIWASDTGRPLTTLRAQNKAVVYGIAFSPDGKRFVTAASDGRIMLWDPATGRMVSALGMHDDRADTVVFSPDGKHVLSGSSDGTARLWDAAGKDPVLVLRGHEGRVWSAAFSPDGATVLTASDDGTARLWDAANAGAVATLRGHEGPVQAAAFSADGETIATVSADRTARIWDATIGQPRAVYDGTGADGMRMQAAAFNPDGTNFATGSEDGMAQVRDLAGGKVLAVLKGHRGPIAALDYSPDGATIVSASDDRTAQIWDAATGRTIRTLEGHTGAVGSVAFSPDGSLIVTASADGTARIWQAADGKSRLTVTGPAGTVTSAAFAPDGRHFVTSSSNGTARIWDSASGQATVSFQTGAGELWSAAYSPDGTLIVTAGSDRSVRIWDSATGRQVAVLLGHGGVVSHAAFSPDSQQVATSSWDGTARVWDVVTGRQLAVLPARGRGPLNTVSYSAGGDYVLAATDDNEALVWDVRDLTARPQALIGDICRDRLRGIAFMSDAERVMTGRFSTNVCAAESDNQHPGPAQ